jgi:hypothetical protein
VNEPPDDDCAEALLRAVLAGEMEETHPAVAALFTADPFVRERLQRMRRLAGQMGLVGREDRTLVHDAGAAGTAHDIALRRAITGVLPRPRRRRIWLAGVAALALAALALSWLLRDDGPTESNTLGGGQIKMQPNGPVERYELFQWDLRVQRRCEYTLRFYVEGVAGELLFEKHGIPTNRWQPEAEDLARMQPRMTWTVTPTFPGEPDGETYRASVSRSP